MDKKAIIDRLHADELSLPTLEEVNFIIWDNRDETLELSKKILGKADECHAMAEEHADTPHAESFLELERSYREGNAELWEHHNATEVEWVKVREDIIRISKSDNSPEEFYKKLLEMHDETQMTKH